MKYIDNCQSCAEIHCSVARPVPIQSYPIPSEPWDTVAIDLSKLPLTTEGHKYLLFAIDHLSRFCTLAPLKDKQATSVSRAMIDEVFCKFNTPKTHLSDIGTEFNNQVLEAICKEYGVTKTNIMAYHPASNGLVERHSSKIIQHLRTLVGDVSTSWQEWMPQVMASLNSSLTKPLVIRLISLSSGKIKNYHIQYYFRRRTQSITLMIMCGWDRQISKRFIKESEQTSTTPNHA